VLREQALELTEVETEALAGMDPEAFRAFADQLDARLRKASHTSGSPVDPRKEN